jgi:DNA-binding transcriptional LysR family regulator
MARRRSADILKPVMGATASRTLVRSPELAELRAFCAAVDLASIGRAARLMHVSQPALSKRLRMLETVAGTPLLERSTRGVTPTASGTQLYREARRLLAGADAIEALMQGFSAEAVPVRIAASPTIAEHWLPAALVALEARHERHVVVELVAANSALVRRMVRDGSADLGVAALDPGAADDGLAQTVVCEDELVLAVPLEHPWARAPEVELEQLAATPLIRRDPGAHSSRTLEAALAARGLAPAAPLAEIGSTTAARAAAVAERAPLLVSRLALGEAERELVVRRVADVDLRRRFALLHAGWIQDLTPSARALARHLLEAATPPPASPRRA